MGASESREEDWTESSGFGLRDGEMLMRGSEAGMVRGSDALLSTELGQELQGSQARRFFFFDR